MRRKSRAAHLSSHFQNMVVTLDLAVTVAPFFIESDEQHIVILANAASSSLCLSSQKCVPI